MVQETNGMLIHLSSYNKKPEDCSLTCYWYQPFFFYLFPTNNNVFVMTNLLKWIYRVKQVRELWIIGCVKFTYHHWIPFIRPLCLPFLHSDISLNINTSKMNHTSRIFLYSCICVTYARLRCLRPQVYIQYTYIQTKFYLLSSDAEIQCAKTKKYFQFKKPLEFEGHILSECLCKLLGHVARVSPRNIDIRFACNQISIGNAPQESFSYLSGFDPKWDFS